MRGSLTQRELGLSSRECRIIKMRERAPRATIAANAAQIRLCVKTVIARLALSAGTGGNLQSKEVRNIRQVQILSLAEEVQTNSLQCHRCPL
jgi:hypothetical protein